MTYFKIGPKMVGQGNPTLVIAEAGVNHNGRLNMAIQLIEAAKMAGADVVKFQTFAGADVATEAAKMADYQSKNLGFVKSQRKMLVKLALPYKHYGTLFKAAKQKGIIILSTPTGGFKSVDLLEKYNVPAYKIGSGDLTNLPLLAYIAKLGKPLIISCGMGTYAEIDEAIDIVTKTGNTQIALLHCTTEYPCPEKRVNLQVLQSMAQKYNYPIGYSDHTTGIEVSVYASLLGATIIEKHITLDKKLPGPDQKNSLEPQEFAALVYKIRKYQNMSENERSKVISHIPAIILGKKGKRPTRSELKTARIVRKSLVWSKNLKKGHLISKQDIDIKRPGTGITPGEYWSIIGKRLRRNVSSDVLISKADFIS